MADFGQVSKSLCLLGDQGQGQRQGEGPKRGSLLTIRRFVAVGVSGASVRRSEIVSKGAADILLETPDEGGGELDRVKGGIVDQRGEVHGEPELFRIVDRV